MFKKSLKKSGRMLTFALAMCVLAACLPGFPTANADNTLPEFVKIADNLYETTYTTDYDWSDTATPDLIGFACSAVQNGQYRGRNYDWTYADTDLCIVHTTVTENRPHASVAVSDMSFIRNADGTYNYEKVPFTTVDGINDAGVCIQVNVMPYGENGELNHTEATDDDLPGSRVVRFVLDYAASVEDAIELLIERDIHSEMGTGNELHWMLSGPASKTDSTIKTVVIEVFPDGLHITENFVDDKPIMTNFNVSNFDGTKESVGTGAGYERWELLDKYYDQADSVMGTFDLMEKVFYSKTYDLYGESFWYSEFGNFDLAPYYSADELKNILGEDVYNSYIEKYGSVYYLPDLWDGEKVLNGDISKAGILAPVVEDFIGKYNAQNMEDGSLWITIHTSVYDLENLTLDIQVRESQDHLHFTIS